MGNVAGVDYSAMVGPMNAAMKAAGCTTVQRAAMWCAQLRTESGGLRWMWELWGPTADQRSYEGRANLGNVNPGDGYRYRGRGPIQLTGRNNYRSFTRWMKSQGLSDLDFEREPDKVAEPHWGFMAAAYYWVNNPNINRYADQGDVLRASAVINGWYTYPNGSLRTPNHYQDRLKFYNQALKFGSALLPTGAPEGNRVIEKILDYPRNEVTQDTIYNCGPASVQTIVAGATGKMHSEASLGKSLGTHTGGTDWIGQFPRVLNQHIPAAKYNFAEIPNDPPTADQKNLLWDRIVNSIGAGYGVVANIVAPPSNYPKAVSPSTINFAYGSGTVYHYIAVMGYRLEGGVKKVWISDSGFYPYGGFISFDQLASLIAPKGYAYATATAPETQKEEGSLLSALTAEEQREVLNLTRENHKLIKAAVHELTHKFQSRYDLELFRQGKITEDQIYSETAIGYALDEDRKVEDMHANMLPTMMKVLEEIREELKEEIANGKK